MAHNPIPDKPEADEALLARVEELRAVATGFDEMYQDYGAEYGDRYTEALSELAAAEEAAGLRHSRPPSKRRVAG